MQDGTITEENPVCGTAIIIIIIIIRRRRNP